MIKQLVEQDSFSPWFTKLFQTRPVFVKNCKKKNSPDWFQQANVSFRQTKFENLGEFVTILTNIT
jgi:hypothetical protein